MLELRDYARLARAAYGTRPALGRWRRVAEFGRASSAFRASLWSAPDEEVHVFAVRGTKSIASAWQDVRLLCGFEPRAWRRGERALSSARQQLARGSKATDIVLTGHSLGGAFAIALAQATGLRAVTFNAPGMIGVLGEPAAPVRALNLCIHGDWIRQLSGPCAGRALYLGPPRRAAAVVPGPFGIVRELARELRRSRSPFTVATRALQQHGLSAFQSWIDVTGGARDAGAWLEHAWSPAPVGERSSGRRVQSAVRHPFDVRRGRKLKHAS